MHRNIRLLALHNFFIDFRPYFAIAILYFQSITGSFALGMAVFTIVMVSSAVWEVPTGIFSDIIGRRASIMLGSVASMVSVFFYALSDGFWLLAVGASLEGLSRSFFSGNNDALLHDTLSQDGQVPQYAEILGKTHSMFQLALALSACIGGLVGEWWSLRLVVWLSVVPQVVCCGISFFFVEPSVHSKESTNIFSHFFEAISHFKTNGRLRLLSLGSIFQHGIGESLFYFSPVFIIGLWPTWGLGMARMLDHLFGWLGFWSAGSVIKRHSAIATLFASLLLSNLLGLFSYGFPTKFSPLLLSVLSLMFGFMMVSLGTLLQQEYAQKQRATMSSITALFGSLFFGVCSIIIGFLADHYGVVAALCIGQLCLFLLLPLYWYLFRNA